MLPISLGRGRPEPSSPLETRAASAAPRQTLSSATPRKRLRRRRVSGVLYAASSPVAADPARVYFITGQPYDLSLVAFDRATFVPAGSVTMSADLYPQGIEGSPRDLVRWGMDGLAFVPPPASEVRASRVRSISSPATSLRPEPRGPEALAEAAPPLHRLLFRVTPPSAASFRGSARWLVHRRA